MIVITSGLWLAGSILGIITWAISRRAHLIARWLLALTLFALGLIYLALLRDSAYQIFLLRGTQDVIAWGKWLPLIVGPMVGLLWPLAKGKRKWVLRLELLLLFAITWLDGGIYQVYGKPPSNPGQEQWLTLQSTSSTCSPAALSALLALYNVRRTEGELIVDCMTTNRGTPLQGIWRGLVKNCPPGFRPNLRHYPEDISARDLELRLPVMINAKLEEQTPETEIYWRNWGWKPGQPHSVILYAEDFDGTLIVGDPSVGVEKWRYEALDVLWDRVALELIPIEK